MKKPIHIFGHINPDTDSICSSIAYGELKKELGETNVEVYRLGKISKETKFVLDYFGVEEPKLLKDIKPQLSDLPYYEPVTVSKDCSLMATWQIMKSSGNSRIVAVVDDKGKLKGVASVGDLANLFMDTLDGQKKPEFLYENILEVVNGEVITGILPKGAMKGKFRLDSQLDGTKDIKKDDIVIISDKNNLKKFLDKCHCIILTDSKKTQAEVKSAETVVISTHLSSIKVINSINKAISVGSVMRTEGIEYFTLDNYIEDVIDATRTSSHRNFPVLDSDDKLVGIVSRRHLIDYKRKKVILIDHNESHQTVEGIENADIIEIIDHHRVANVQTLTPLFIRSEPVGASSTIIFKMYMENFLRPTRAVAGIMLSAILSDTLMFNSPTCTQEDKEAAHKLAKLAGVDLDEYGEQMFRESAVFDDYSADDLLQIDRKEFSFGKHRVFISQVNCINFKKIASRQDELLKTMEVFKNNSGCDMVLLMITDIINTGSEIIATETSGDVLTRAFGMPKGSNNVYLPDVVSRKKQIVPLLMRAFQV